MKNIVGELAKSVSIQHPNIQMSTSPQNRYKNSLAINQEEHCFALIPQQLYIDSFQHKHKTYVVHNRSAHLRSNQEYTLSYQDVFRTEDNTLIPFTRYVPVVKIDY